MGRRNQPINGFTVTRASRIGKRVPIFRGTVRGWICVGLGVTAAAAYVVAGSPAIMQAIVSTGYKGFVGQEFIPKHKEPLVSLKRSVQICDV